jgi:hypothetical protein
MQPPERERVKGERGHACEVCGSRDRLVIDHLRRVADGGSHERGEPARPLPRLPRRPAWEGEPAVNDPPDLIIDRAALEDFFERHFGDACLLGYLIEDVVIREVGRHYAAGQPLSRDAFAAHFTAVIERTIAALIEAEAR